MCTTGDTAHIDTIFKFLPHTLGFLVLNVEITEKIMKRPVYIYIYIYIYTYIHKGSVHYTVLYFLTVLFVIVWICLIMNR